MIKPFRLISSSEMTELNMHFMQVIDDWNQEYAMTPLLINLEAPPYDYVMHHDGFSIINADDQLAVVDKEYLDVLNLVLFGENNSCFNAVSRELLLLLLNRFLKTEECSISETKSLPPNWFYRGSTCLFLTLSANQNTIKIILSPDWVYQNLSPYQTVKYDLCSLDEALEDELVNIEVTLLPVKLPIEQLLTIQVGDVLVTDHLLSDSLRVTHKDQVLAQADLGQSLQQKSILLKGSS